MNTTTEPKTIIVGPGITVLDEPGEHSVKWFATPASASSVDIRQVSATTAHLVVLKGNEHWIGNYKGSVIAWFRIVTKSAAPASWAWLAKPWGWIKSAASYAKPVLPFVLTAALAVGAFAVMQQQGCSLPWPVDPVNPVDPPKPPTPPPSPAPIPASGFRMLIVYEDGDLHKMPQKQVQAMKSKAVLDYLDLRCISVNGAKEWRIWDRSISTANVSKLWQDAFAKATQDSNGALPWLIVSNGVTGFSGPMPSDETSLLDLLKKYGGV